MNLASVIDEMCCDFGVSLESPAVMNAVVSRLVAQSPVAAAGIWHLDRAQAKLSLVCWGGNPASPERARELPADHPWLGKALRTELPQAFQPAPVGDDGLSEWVEQEGLRFLTAYPLAGEGQSLGALVVACAEPPDEPWPALFRLQARVASLALRDAEMVSRARYDLDKLQFLVEASKALNSTLDLSELLARILEVAKGLAKAERGTLFLVDDRTQEIWSLIAQGIERQEIRLPLGRGIAGHVAKSGEIVNIPDAYSDSRFDPEVDKRTGFRTRNLLTLPLRNRAGKIVAALQLLNKLEGSFTQEDTDYLLMLSGHMAVSIENAQLHRALLEKERLEREVALARGIQRSLLPETTPVVAGFDIAVLNEPCFEVGGDYYDFLNMGPHTLLVVVADVEGKGISSALVMSNLQATLRALVLNLHALNDLAETLNRMILTDTRGEKYMTIFIGLIDTRGKSVHYINCGHVPPVIVRAHGSTTQLTEGGMVIGLFEDVSFQRGYAKLQPGDILVLCTDGITEAMDLNDQEFGLERLTASVSRTRELKAKEIVSSVYEDVREYSRGGAHVDDKIILAIKVQ